jgi:hypothetical protein
VPDHELRIRITAPTEGDGYHWGITIRDLVLAEHGEHMRLDIPEPRLVNPPGSTREQLPAEHAYLSTGCLHGDHAYCQSMTGLNGAKRPSQCKFCAASCRCFCHLEAGE